MSKSNALDGVSIEQLSEAFNIMLDDFQVKIKSCRVSTMPKSMSTVFNSEALIEALNKTGVDESVEIEPEFD